MKFLQRFIAFVLMAWVPTAFGSTGSWNGVNFTALNAIAQTSWNGTGISCAGGGGASAFTFGQVKTGTNDGAQITSVTMDSSITAGQLVYVHVKWEGANAVTAVSENGGAMTALTQGNEAGGDLHGRDFYKLVATGGGTTISLTWSGSATFCRVIVYTFSYGGTASFLGEGAFTGSGVGTGTSTTPASGAVTNSGTYRLNISGYAAYSSGTVTLQTIGGSSVTLEPAAQVNDCWSWWNTVNLSSGTSNADISGGTNWVCSLNCFAAN